MERSAMRIVPNNPEALLCSHEGVRADALDIFDATKDGDKQWNYHQCQTGSAGIGYQYGSEKKGRHNLAFCNLDPDDVAGTQEKPLRMMIHELGHAIGLQHGHQRNDRHLHTTFTCENLAGYEEAERVAKYDDDMHLLFDINPTLFGTDDAPIMEERTRMVCNDGRFARAYFKTAFSFMTGVPTRLSEFDFDSIMIYKYFDFSPAGTNVNDPKKWVLVRKDGSPVLQGGSTDAALATISKGDIERVGQLCTLTVLEAVGTGDRGGD